MRAGGGERLRAPHRPAAAGFDRLYSFHSLGHSAVTSVYRLSRDLFLAQRFTRHMSPLTTTVETHRSDDELDQRVRGLSC